ncbi:hypothetical protein D3C87_2042100 [compost metagenome]
MHHCDNLNVLANPVGDDIGNVGQYNFACAGDATDTTSGRQLRQHIDGRYKPGDHPCSGIWIVVFNVRADFVKPPQRPYGPAYAPLLHD